MELIRIEIINSTHPGAKREVVIVRVLALYRVIEVACDPFDADLAVVDAAGLGVLGGDEGLDEEVGHVGK